MEKKREEKRGKSARPKFAPMKTETEKSTGNGRKKVPQNGKKVCQKSEKSTG